MFVCLGNICRSPLAHGVFRDLVSKAALTHRFEIASSGTGAWHVGESPDARMQQTARHHGISLGDLRAQQFQPADLDAFDHIFVMDKHNLHDVLYLDRDDRHGHKVRLFREFDPEPGDYQVPDPYYGGPQGFDHVFAIVERTARHLLHQLVQESDLAGGKEDG
ncbi:MAG: low molecular weight protein-tyrosine-phosphatase [Rhodothermales bacterium]